MAFQQNTLLPHFFQRSITNAMILAPTGIILPFYCPFFETIPAEFPD